MVRIDEVPSDAPPSTDARAFQPKADAAAHTQGKNRRTSPRFAVECEVTLVSDHDFYSGFAENLSTGGIFVATHVLRPIGERMELAIKLEGVPDPVRGVGEVRWVRMFAEDSDVPPGIGFRFADMTGESLALIECFCRSRRPPFSDDE